MESRYVSRYEWLVYAFMGLYIGIYTTGIMETSRGCNVGMGAFIMGMIKPTVQQNMKAARLCGYSISCDQPDEGIAVCKDKEGFNMVHFNLSNKADLLDTVKALGDKCHCFPKPTLHGWCVATLVQGILTDVDLTYEESVLAALDLVEVGG